MIDHDLDFLVGQEPLGSGGSFHAGSGGDVQMHTGHFGLDNGPSGGRTEDGQEFDSHHSWRSSRLGHRSPGASPSAAAPIIIAPIPVPVVVQRPPPRRTGRIRKQVVKLGQFVPPVVPLVAAAIVPPLAIAPPAAVPLAAVAAARAGAGTRANRSARCEASIDSNAQTSGYIRPRKATSEPRYSLQLRLNSRNASDLDHRPLSSSKISVKR